MNIIEAFQKAENGQLITNNLMKVNNRFLKYTSQGVFHEYKLVDSYPEYLGYLKNFSMAEIISIGWEIFNPDNISDKNWIKDHKYL